jgi:uncharacterized protein YyaL (SSP411 family)
VPNRLADSASPYLLQHMDNPVDWWPWCAEAFDEARRRDVPVLLSIGYAACHWCHVMAHESFEDRGTAAFMNAHFVNVKVDREERPDVDAVYMEAVQAMTGQGGWPLTAILTPAGEPFFCGTYFPPEDRHGLPSFRRVLAAVAAAWEQRRDELAGAARRVVEQLADQVPGTGVAVSAESADRAAGVLAAEFDESAGGFGGAPKFPPAMLMEFLLRQHARTGSDRSLHLVERTADRMARGGIYDQLAGGFARYSVDAHWVVPHFEKMLYDNALLLRVYSHLYRATAGPLARRVVEETADWLLTELRTPEEGFASSLDADSEGQEGRFYVWSPAELVAALGEEDAGYAASVFSVTPDGTFEDGRSVLQRLADPPDQARFADVRRRLLAARARRPRPARDDKVVAGWNGLAVAGLVDAGVLLDRPEWLAAAEQAAGLLERVHLSAGRLARTSRAGRPGPGAGVLEDYGDLAEGLLTLAQATGRWRWLDRAGELLDSVLAHFADPAGVLYDTADDAEQLLRRPRDPTDNATPSGTSAAAGALLSYAALTGSERHREAAGRALAATVPVLDRYPRFAGWALAVAEAMLAGPAEVVVVGPVGGRLELERAARLGTSPGMVLAVGEPGGSGPPLLAGRGLVDGAPAGYVCRRFVCSRPTTDPAELAAQVGARCYGVI